MTCAIFSATGRPKLYLDVPVVLVTAVVLQSPMGWLSPEVLLDMLLIVVAVPVFQSPTGWLNTFAKI